MNNKIVVIGAGASGIAAATKLLELGFRNISVLEAENRIGGRINTISFGAHVVDLGAQWCHGEKGNAVYELANELNLLGHNDIHSKFFRCIRSNKEIVPHETSNRLGKIIEDIMGNVEELATYEGSLGAYLTDKYYEALRKPENQDLDINIAQKYFDFYQKFECSVEASDSLFDVSARGYLQYWDCEGDKLLNWKDKGYKTILKLLMKSNDGNEYGVLEDCVQLNKAIQEIDWCNRSDQKVAVKCCDGDVIEADHVICTVSLGVLKEKFLTLFKPNLPLEKINAIQGLSIGTVNKMFLEFSTPFWPQDWDGFSLLWEENDLEEIRNSTNPWLQDVFGFYTVSHQPNILCGWIYGVEARSMERIPEEDVCNSLLSLLRKYLNWQIPDPVAFVRSSWYNNSNFRGSYSFRSMKTEELNTCAAELATPLCMGNIPKVLFAGEASHDHYYSTVHGAIESGWREANRLHRAFNRRNSHL